MERFLKPLQLRLQNCEKDRNCGGHSVVQEMCSVIITIVEKNLEDLFISAIKTMVSIPGDN